MTREAQQVCISARVRQLAHLADLTSVAYAHVETVLMQRLQEIADGTRSDIAGGSSDELIDLPAKPPGARRLQ